MSRWTLCKRRDFIFRLRELGFNGPFSESKHHFWFTGSVAWQARRILNPLQGFIPGPLGRASYKAS